MSPKPRQTSMAKNTTSERSSRKSAIHRSAPGSASVSPTIFTNEMLQYPSHSRSETLRNDDPIVWSETFSGHFSGHDDAHFDPLHMESMAMTDNSYIIPVMTSSHCFNSPTFDQFTQGPMSQTLTGPLLEPSYEDVMMADDMMHVSPVSMEFPGYGQPSQHTWRHGQLSPPAEIFHPELSDFPMDSSCDMSFPTLPESAVSGVFAYDKIHARSVC